MLVAHLLAIRTGVIDPMGALATGTLTVLSWFAGWLVALKIKGPNDFVVRLEAAVLLSALFQLGVGAFAFSRVYYGWLAGHEKDLFHSLSSLYLHEDEYVPDFVAEWWEESSSSRFSGVGWWLCEICDITAHQVPFVIMVYVLRSNGLWQYIHDHIRSLWPLVAVAGPLHRYAWDLCTCGHAICDGPYRGFLAEIPALEQFLWHFAPCVLLCAYFADDISLSSTMATVADARDRVSEETVRASKKCIAAARAAAPAATPSKSTTLAM